MKKSKNDLSKYLEEKKSSGSRIDAAQLTTNKKSHADELISYAQQIAKNLETPKKFKAKESLKHGEQIVFPVKTEAGKGFWRGLYDFVFGWILTKKSENENVFQFSIRQALPPDSSGKPSWQLFIVLWSLVVMSYVTVTEIQVALSYVVQTDAKTGAILTKKLRGFSEPFIYFVMMFGGIVSGLFYKREKDRKAADGTNAAPTEGVLNSIKDRVTAFISKK